MVAPLKRHVPLIAIFVIVISLVWTDLNNNLSRSTGIIAWDVSYYYAYLPMIVIHQDLKLDKLDEQPDLYTNMFRPSIAENGARVNKTTYGLALMYAPFFFVAHYSAPWYGFAQNGYNAHYTFWLLMGTIVYLFLGLLMLMHVLRRFFDEWVTTLTLLAVVIGTNLLYYATFEGAMPHAYIFTLVAAFLLVTVRFYENPTPLRIAVFGLVFGLLVLVRPINIAVLLFFICYGISSLLVLKQRVLFFVQRPHWVLLSVAMFLLLWLPQLLYWKYTTGSYWFMSYTGERFFWDDPKLLLTLFGYRKGWLVYTPIMILALLGIPLLFGRFKKLGMGWAVLLPFAIYAYALSCWWCWWFGGGYGLRPYIDIYPLLAIPFAAFLQWGFSFNIKPVTTLLVVLLLVFTGHSVFQTIQKKKGVIHWDSMTKEAYWEAFGRLKPSEEINQYLEAPNYGGAYEGTAR